MLSLTECVWDFRHSALWLWNAHWHAHLIDELRGRSAGVAGCELLYTVKT